MAVRLAADLRPSADGSAVRTSLVAGSGYSLGQLHRGTDRRTDGGIAVSLNAPSLTAGGIKKTSASVKSCLQHRNEPNIQYGMSQT